MYLSVFTKCKIIEIYYPQDSLEKGLIAGQENQRWACRVTENKETFKTEHGMLLVQNNQNERAPKGQSQNNLDKNINCNSTGL